MNLSNLKASQTITITLKNPETGELVLNDSDNTAMTIDVYSSHTKEYKKAERESDKSEQYKLITKGKEAAELTAEQLYLIDDLRNQRLRELITSILVSCNIDKTEKSKVKVDELKEILAQDDYAWILTQIQEGASKGAVFIKA